MSNNKTIARNTIFLYFRMFLIMLVSLFTSKIVLKALGIEDYGLYNVVGGIVTIFGFINASMTASTERFFAFELGKKNYEQLNKVFNVSLSVHLIMALLLLILCETFGLWFINHKLNVSPDRIEAANIVFQFSTLSFLIGVIQVPFNSIVIAYEKMNLFAIIGIVEAILKLTVTYLLFVSTGDRLVIYSLLLTLVSFINFAVYFIYCKINIKGTNFYIVKEKKLFKEILSYSGWNLFGNSAVIARNQGRSILLNLYFGVTLNAAYAITAQVYSAINVFVSNLMVAFNPQIIKSYSAGDLERSKKLILESSKVSFFVILIISSPILFNLDYILNLWLDDVPEFTAIFIRLSIINMLIDSLSYALMTGAQATGNIKKYQIVVGILVFLNLPFYFLFLNIIKVPQVLFYVSIVIALFSLSFRIYFLKKVLDFDIKNYLKEVILRILIVTTLSYAVIYTINSNVEIDNFFKFSVFSLLYVGVIIISVIFLGISRKQLGIIINYGKSKYTEYKSR